MTDGIIVYDAAGRVSSMNLATHSLFELEPGEQATASAARCDLLREDGTALPAGDSPVLTMQRSGPGFDGGAGLERSGVGLIRRFDGCPSPRRQSTTHICA